MGAALAESPYYAGVVAGVSTLSADGRSAPPAASLYKPENGLIAGVLGGIHLREYLSVQGNWTWNRNDLTLTSIRAGGVFQEERRRSTQHSLAVDMLLYFRNRASWARPFLSVGGGVVRFRSTPGAITSTEPALRVAVGIDMAIRDGWAFRYSFCETIRSNPISAQLTPPGTRNLAHFQNLFGFVKNF